MGNRHSAVTLSDPYGHIRRGPTATTAAIISRAAVCPPIVDHIVTVTKFEVTEGDLRDGHPERPVIETAVPKK